MLFDDMASKMGTMVLMSTVNQFMEYCIEEKMTPTVEKLKLYIFENTGKDVSNEFVELLLKLVLNNVQIAILYAVNEASEKIAENMLDKPSNYMSFLRGII